MNKPRAFLFLSLLLFLAQNSEDYLNQMFGILSTVVYLLTVIVAPLLLLYGFLKGTLDVFGKSSSVKLCFCLFTVAETALDFLSRLGEVCMALILIILPFTLVLLMWKTFTKVVKL